jgi:hypothetical protein
MTKVAIRNQKSKNIYIRVAITTMSCMLLMGAVMSSMALAAPGDGIIEPGEDVTEELARSAQNPVASMISLPFQNNTNFNFGPENKTQNVLNVQPVWPFSLSDEWNLITRTIVPVISQPETAPGTDRTFGIGDTFFSAFFSPKDYGKWIWGVGPAVLAPTATDDYLGLDRWAAGPSAVVLTISGPWVAGSLFSNIWDFAGSGDADINLFTWQPFVNYNMDDGWYLASSPLITADWENSGDEWTVPLGGGFGKIFRIGSQPMNASAHAYYNVEAPDNAADWQLRLQLQFLFPK